MAAPNLPIETWRESVTRGAPAPTPVSPQANKSATPAPVPVKNKSGSNTGVGGDSDDTFIFHIGILKKDKSDIDPSRMVRIELAPARRSTHEKSGQQVPGAGFGMEFRSRTNLAKLPIPGAKPTYQNMGIAEETLDWVGAFIGMDVEQGNSANYEKSGENWRDNSSNALDQSNALLAIFKKGQELGVKLKWNARTTGGSSNEHSILFESGTQSSIFTGFVKEFHRAYATEHKVYYRISFVVTNREDPTKFLDPTENAAVLKDMFPGSMSVGMPRPENTKLNRDLADEITKNNGHTFKQYEDLAQTFSDPNSVNQVLASLRDEKNNALDVEKLKEVKKNIEVYKKYSPYLKRGANISSLSPADKTELQTAVSELTTVLEKSSSPELRTAVDGMSNLAETKLKSVQSSQEVAKTVPLGLIP